MQTKALNSELLSSLQNLPNSAGVYQYFSASGRLLYIGKAKSLKSRVKSYFRFTPNLAPAKDLSPRITKMISEVASLRYILANSANDALILENSLIKQLRPKYNILLRDDKTYPYFCVDFSAAFPRITLTRKVLKAPKLRYFGPFANGARALLDSIYENFSLVQKESCLRAKKACLFAQIGRCKAPCENRINEEEYAKILQNALSCVQNPRKIISILENKMHLLAEQERFEEAVILRDRIATISAMSVDSSIDFADNSNLDIFVFVSEKEPQDLIESKSQDLIESKNQDSIESANQEKSAQRGVLVKFFMRNGKIISSANSRILSDYAFSLNELYSHSIINFYKDKQSRQEPDCVLVGDDLSAETSSDLAEFLKNEFGKKIEILHPKSGDKKRICELAQKNGEEILRLLNKDSQKSQKERTLRECKELFGLENTPFRIEVFDTSHHRGAQSVGAMIVWDLSFTQKEESQTPQNSRKNRADLFGFVREDYRCYKLKSGDEYSQMREMLCRRIADFEKENPPSLWLLDGGAAQINLARELLASAGIRVEVLGIAKEKLDSKAHRAKGAAFDIIRGVDFIESNLIESDLIESSADSMQKAKLKEWRLAPSDRRLQFLQALRDEAHRFAISFHRAQKQKTMHQSELLEVAGIGAATQKKLLNFFGDFESIRKASIEDLAQIIPHKLATALKESLKDD